MKKRAIAYMRTGTADQRSTSSLADQLAALREYADLHGFEIVECISDIGSGATLDRPGLTDARARLARRDAAAILVTDISRLARMRGRKYDAMIREMTTEGRELHTVDFPGALLDVARRRLADADAGNAATLTLDEVKARLAPMTEAEKREQRISFVYGNVSLSNPNVTREMVERLVDEEDRNR
jgi:DNA invertase Pin-like site-specific DNA recombinase